jgi:signal transduction histidine kinase
VDGSGRDAAFIRDAAVVLMDLEALRDVLDVVPQLVLRRFGALDTCRVVLFGDGEDGGDACACVPLRHAGELVGFLLLDWSGDSRVPSGWDESQVADLAHLAAATIVNRRRLSSIQERVHVEAVEFKIDLIAMLSHEMRTPLASIKGFASTLLLDGIDWDEATRREFVEAIDEECDHLTEMVTHLLDSTVIEAGGLELRREPILLVGMVRRLINKMSKRTDRHRFVTSFGDGFPVVEADEQRILQVLTNLLDNAVKYSPDGGLIVVGGEEAPGEVIVSVADQGIGIAPEHLNKLFERFFRTNQPNHGVSGTGLGLPIAEAIVRAHGGRIWAESVLGEGTTLSFSLPATIAESEADE